MTTHWDRDTVDVGPVTVFVLFYPRDRRGQSQGRLSTYNSTKDHNNRGPGFFFIFQRSLYDAVLFSGIFSWCGASMTCCPPGRWCTWGCLLWCCWCWYCCNSRSWWLGGRGNCWCPLSESPVFSLAALRRLLESLSPLPSERARGGFIVAGGTINWGGGSTTFPFSPRYFMVHSILALVVIGSDYRDRCLGPASFTSPPSSPSKATEETLWS